MEMLHEGVSRMIGRCASVYEQGQPKIVVFLRMLSFSCKYARARHLLYGINFVTLILRRTAVPSVHYIKRKVC